MVRPGVKQIARKSTGALPPEDQTSPEPMHDIKDSRSTSVADETSMLTENEQNCVEENGRQELEQRMEEESNRINELENNLEELSKALLLSREKSVEAQTMNNSLETENRNLRTQLYQIRHSLMEVCLQIPN